MADPSPVEQAPAPAANDALRPTFDIFLCHNSQEKALIRQIDEQLRDASGLRPWLDEYAIAGGARWHDEIRLALRSCRACAVFLGECGWGSEHRREAAEAIALRRELPDFVVVPVLLPGGRVEDLQELGADLANVAQWADFRGGLDNDSGLWKVVKGARPDTAPYEPTRLSAYAIRKAAKEWRRSTPEGRPGNQDFLLRGSQLREAQKVAEREAAQLNAAAWEFLNASSENEQRRFADERRRYRRTIGGLFLGLVLIGLGAAAALWQRSVAVEQRTVADEQRRVAVEERNTAVSRERAMTSMAHLATDPVDSVATALQALDASPTPAAEFVLRRAVAESHAWRILTGHKGGVWGATASPDGRLVATTGTDGTVRVWEVESGKQLASLPEHGLGSRNMAFDPRGSHLLTTTRGVARLWSRTDWSPFADLRAPKRDPTTPFVPVIVSATYNPDGSRIATISTDKIVRVWDIATSQYLRHQFEHPAAVTLAAFSPDGALIVTRSEDDIARVLNIETGELVTTLNTEAGQRHTALLHGAFFTPDGKQVVTSSADETARLWDARSGAAGAILQSPSGPVMDAICSPDGRYLVTFGRSDGVVWELPSGRRVKSLETGGSGGGFSDDGRWLVTAGGGTRTARVWSTGTWQLAAELRGHIMHVASAAFIPKTLTVVTTSHDGTARFWRPLPIRTTIDGKVTSVDFGPDPFMLLVARAGGDLQLADARTGAIIRTVGKHPGATFAKFSPQGTHILSAGDDDTARIWNHQTGEFVILEGHGSDVRRGEFSPDGKLVVTGSFYRVRIWDAATGKLLRELEPSEIGLPAVAFHPDGKRVAIGMGSGRVIIADWQSRKVVMDLTPHAREIVSLAFDSKGSRLVTASGDRSLRVIDVASQAVSLLGRVSGSAFGAVFSQDDRLIATASDGQARVWNADSREPVFDLPGIAYPQSIAFNWDESLIAVSGLEPYAFVYDCRACGPVDRVRAYAEAYASALRHADAPTHASKNPPVSENRFTSKPPVHGLKNAPQ